LKDDFQLNNSFTDVVFKLTKNCCISAHRIILSARSEVFKNMFEKSTDALPLVIELPEIEEPIFRNFIHFIYSGKNFQT